MDKDICTVRKFINNEWVDDDFKNLKKDDRFQIINPDGTYHYDEFGNTDWVAISEVYLNENGIWQIDTI